MVCVEWDRTVEFVEEDVRMLRIQFEVQDPHYMPPHSIHPSTTSPLATSSSTHVLSFSSPHFPYPLCVCWCRL